MSKSKRIEIRFSFNSNSRQARLIESLRQYALSTNQSFNDLVFLAITSYWLPIILQKKEDFSDELLQELAEQSVTALEKQIQLILSKSNLNMEFRLYSRGGDLLSQNRREEDDNDHEDWDSESLVESDSYPEFGFG